MAFRQVLLCIEPPMLGSRERLVPTLHQLMAFLETNLINGFVHVNHDMEAIMDDDRFGERDLLLGSSHVWLPHNGASLPDRRSR